MEDTRTEECLVVVMIQSVQSTCHHSHNVSQLVSPPPLLHLYICPPSVPLESCLEQSFLSLVPLLTWLLLQAQSTGFDSDRLHGLLLQIWIPILPLFILLLRLNCSGAVPAFTDSVVSSSVSTQASHTNPPFYVGYLDIEVHVYARVPVTRRRGYTKFDTPT